MKKRCVSQNNAIVLDTTVVCPCPIVPPVVAGCIDPLTYTFNIAVANSIQDGVSVDEAFITLLDIGMILPSGNEICCPDCSESPFYSLSSLETLLKLAEALDWVNMEPRAINYCCINTDSAIETYLKYNEAMASGGDLPECCDTNFTSCVATLNSYGILATGIAEVNTLNGDTAICTLINLLTSISEPAYLAGTITDFFNIFLDKGFVAFCCGCNIVIGSVETFLKYYETGACLDIFPLAKIKE